MVHNSKGFTLLELLVVVAIIGILAAIAIPHFSEYRAQSVCSRVVSDAKNAFLNLESFYAGHLRYGTLIETGFKGTHNVSVTIVSETPLAVSGIDLTGQCPQGTTYTLTQGSGHGAWGP